MGRRITCYSERVSVRKCVYRGGGELLKHTETIEMVIVWQACQCNIKSQKIIGETKRYVYESTIGRMIYET